MAKEGAATEVATWLIRIPEVFGEWRDQIIRDLGGKSMKSLGKDYDVVRIDDASTLFRSDAAKFLSWRMPIHHSWPCNPAKTDGFVEKAAQALAKKFADGNIQAVMVSALDPGSSDRYFRLMASNLRGRMLQLFPEQVAAVSDAEEQDAMKDTLFCFVGKEGLFAGVQSPKLCGGFFAGGTKFIKQSAPEVISRAGAKVAEALHHVPLMRPVPEIGSHWLELGASPGGMTAELLARGYQVTAIDRAPLDARLKKAKGLRSVVGDAASFRPPSGVTYDVVLSDMNGDARDALAHVIRLSENAKRGALVVFTLKLPGSSAYEEVNQAVAHLLADAKQAGLQLLQCKHLTYNRMEFTCFFVIEPLGGSVEGPRSKVEGRASRAT